MNEIALGNVVEPIRVAFPPLKAKSWLYKIHPYYTRQPLNVVEEYVRHFCPKGGLVVDPFCGSGVTAVAALGQRKRFVGIDLDPLAVFITRQSCIAPVDLEAYWEAYRQVEKEMKPIVKYIRSASPKDLENYQLKKWYPRRIRLPSNADREYVEELFGEAQLITLAHLRAAIMRIKHEQARGLLLFVFSGILARASITYGIDPKHAGGGDSGIFKVYRYWVPPNPDYRDVWDLFATRARLVAKAKNDSNIKFNDFVREGETFCVYQDSAENLLKYVEKGTVDYIYTDPPYGAHIAYLDLSTMWHSWLGFEVTDEMREKEAIEGGEKQLDEQHYLNILQKSFEQMFYALRNVLGYLLSFITKRQTSGIRYVICFGTLVSTMSTLLPSH
jgi:adenine-specific DNA methylase